jgi:hypothetical protein
MNPFEVRLSNHGIRQAVVGFAVIRLHVMKQDPKCL